jgi:tetratricopeptide (TPR) repeat protein
MNLTNRSCLLRILRAPLAILFLLLLTASGVAQSLEKLIKKCGPAVVVFKDTEGTVVGSGVLVSSDGIVLTADHLFTDGEDFTVSLHAGQTLPVKRFLYRDAGLDLAALEVGGRDLPFVAIGDPQKVGIGAAVVAIGNPRGLENTVSQGIISGKREITKDAYLLQTSAPISPGSSGGGLFDESGRLLAIIVSYLEDSQNLNFAIPIHYADFAAMRKLDQQIAAAPAGVDGYLARAQAYLDVEEYELALVDLRQALQLDTQSAEAHRLRGEVYYWQDRYPEALQDFSTVIRLQPAKPQGYYDRGFAYLGMKRNEEAIADFQSAVEKDADYEYAYSGLGMALSALDRDSEAAEAWTQAIRLDPADASYYESRGECYFWCENFEAASTDLLKAIELDSVRPKAYLFAGRILAIEGDSDNALAAFEASIALEPNALSYYHRALVHNNLENYEKALADIDRAVEQGATDASAYDLRGDIFYNLGRYDRAALEYSKALEVDPEALDVVKDRGDAYAAVGDVISARADYQYVIDNDASGELAKEAKAELLKLKE